MVTPSLLCNPHTDYCSSTLKSHSTTAGPAAAVATPRTQSATDINRCKLPPHTLGRIPKLSPCMELSPCMKRASCKKLLSCLHQPHRACNCSCCSVAHNINAYSCCNRCIYCCAVDNHLSSCRHAYAVWRTAVVLHTTYICLLNWLSTTHQYLQLLLLFTPHMYA